MKPMYPFLIALQFLTRIPVRLSRIPDESEVTRSLLYYPLVGLILGLALTALNILLADSSASIRAALVLTAWVILTGALHLDGLADSVDAWAGSHGNRERALTIMKDPRSGPIAVTALIIVLLLKFATLINVTTDLALLLVLTPILARSAIPLLFITTPYVRAGGLGQALANHPSLSGNLTVIIVTWLISIALAGIQAITLLLVLGITFLIMRAAMMKRIGGTTGDTAGALIETSETTMLLASVLILQQ